MRFGASKCVSERRNAFRSVKMRFGASKCVSERQNAFRSVEMRFGASKCVSERRNAFRSVGVGGDLLRFEFRIAPAGWGERRGQAPRNPFQDGRSAAPLVPEFQP